jgi:protein N-terminal methyltransferase
MHKPTHPTQPQVEKHKTRALDVGSGIGRVTANVLLLLVDSVDLVEPVEHFLAEALRAAQQKEWKALQRSTEQDKRLKFYKQGLQHFNPEKPDEDACIGSVGSAEDDAQMGYDVIWGQWCLGHREHIYLRAISPLITLAVSDDQLIEWLKACKRALRQPDSVIVIKENVTHPNSLREYDAQDRSWTR